MRRFTILIATLLGAYLAAYLTVRTAYLDVRPQGGVATVIFPEDGLLYTLFRPAAYLDAALTGMQFHLGPHL